MRTVNSGKIFEREIKDSIPDDVWYFRISDPATSFGTNSSIRFSSKNPFDSLMFRNGVLVAMELKSNQGTSIPFSLKDDKKQIKSSQVRSLKRSKEFKIVSGFILNYRKNNVTYWIDIDDFLSFAENTEKKSINQKDVIQHGGIVIEQKLKKRYYTYDLNFLLERSD